MDDSVHWFVLRFFTSKRGSVMQTAYWNEPKPLKMAYPSGSNLGDVMTICACFLLLLSTCIVSGVNNFPGTPWLFLLISFAPVMLAIGLFFLAGPAGQWQHNCQWKKAFLVNNQDLELNVTAVKQAMRHLKRHTSYRCINFENVATHLACSLRQADRFSSSNHTTFSWEVLHAYLHFATGEVDLQPTRCPKAV